MNALRVMTTGMTIALALLAAACQPRLRPPVEPREDPSVAPQINLADRELQQHFAVRAPMVSQDEAGLMFVTVPVRNTSARQYTIEYRATFFDRNKLPIQQTTWFPMTMTPHTQQTFTINATSRNADDFQIDIRPAK